MSTDQVTGTHFGGLESSVQAKLEESGHCQDIAGTDYTMPLQIEEVDDSLQLQINDGLQFALATSWSKVSQDTDLSEMKLSRGHIGNSNTPAAETEAKKHEVQEIAVVDDAGIFQVDRTQIEEVQLSDQAAELQVLGLSVYDQDTLERGILQQVDQALEQLNKKQLEEQMETVADEIISCKRELKKSEILLKALAGRKQAVSVMKSVETFHKQLATLEVRSDTLQLKHTNMGRLISECNSDAVNSPDVTLGKERQSQESEQERRIRLGEMTPFGSVLGNQLTSAGSTSNTCLSEFEKYLQNQAELDKQKRKGAFRKNKVAEPHVNEEEVDEEIIGENDQKKGTKRNSPLKKNILMPKKRLKKEKLGTHSSNNWWDQKEKPDKLLSEQRVQEDSEGSEYLPSESELEDTEENGRCIKVPTKKTALPMKCRQRQYERQDPEEWGTDDSDWDYSDEETRSKRRKNTKKEIDDGNIEDYNERLKLWEEQRLRQAKPEQTGDHEIEGGFKLPKDIWSKLYNYQKVGVQWLWELNQQRCGGIVGDEMGLGKTVQVIAFLTGLHYSKLLLRHGKFRGLGPSIIICPTTVMHQWVREFHIWCPRLRVAILHDSGSFNGKRKTLISQMNSVGCVLVTSYAGTVHHQEALMARDWHYVILDEGHKIRNPDAQVTLAVKQFRTPHRLIVSGSPMQNNLKELWSLFDFIFPGKLGTLPVFLAQMAVPITQGGYSNASEVQVATAYRCATVLRDTIAPYLLRRMKADVKSHIHLPPKNEQVLFCRLTEEQRSIYKGYLDSNEVGRILDGRFKIFVGLAALRKICNHPDLFSGGPKLLCGENEEDLQEENRYGYWRRAGKMLVIQSLLSIWQKQGHRVLLFTQSRQMLCILEAFVQKQGYRYLKMDGGTNVASRQPLVTRFNEDPSYFVFLLTTRVGGIGVNLTGADRVVIYDPDWNPATDTQARERAWRIGQQNNVTVYRLITAGTIEEKVYHRQIFKQFLCNRVLQDPRQQRFFKSNDLAELFTLAESEQTTETAAIFAGTGSEVKMKSHKTKSCKKKKNVHQKMSGLQELKNVKFSASKVERMKRLAQLLSKQIVAMNKQDTDTKIAASVEVCQQSCSTSHASGAVYKSGANRNTVALDIELVTVEDCVSNEKKSVSKSETAVEDELHVEREKSLRIKTPCEHHNQQQVVKDLAQNRNNSDINNPELREKSCSRGTVKSHRHRRKHHHGRKHSRRGGGGEEEEKGAMFEGERVSYLVGQYKAEEVSLSAGNGEDRSVEEDDYVLRKLFKKSGIQTAMRHDSIMEGYADFALVEGEARRVAKDAVQALKESRRQCWQADAGVPSWTGQSGALRSHNISATQARLRFGKKKMGPHSSVSASESKSEGNTLDASNEQPMTSKELLSRMRIRNYPLMPEPGEEEEGEEEAQRDNAANSISSHLSVSVEKEHIELLTDIRNFVAFGASADRRASTQEIIAQFSERLPPGSSPLFKFMLSEVCEFHRMPSGRGVWRLRSEFRW